MATAPTNAQNTFKIDPGGALYINIFAPDFETDCGSTTSSVYGAGVNVTPGFADGIAAHWGEWANSMKVFGTLTANATVFPDSDPHVTGAGYWVAGVLTKSAG